MKMIPVPMCRGLFVSIFFNVYKACNPFLNLLYYLLSLLKPNPKNELHKKSSCNEVGRCDILIKSPLKGRCGN
jgi:hypothetical protein